MQTSFSPARLADPHMAASEKILRACVHCGFCTATCPTYLLLGDELDSPRGRIYMIKDMLESGRPASADVVKHVDRCLSCLSCMTTCPSGVHYMHLVDHARAHIEATWKRPWPQRLLRTLLAQTLPYPARFRLALGAARLARPFAPLIARLPQVGAPLAAMLALSARPRPAAAAETARPHGAPVAGIAPVARVALLEGCAQPVLAPGINAAARRVLARHGVEVVPAPGEGCCGALVHHMGREAEGLALARANVDAWWAAMQAGPLDAILITASGCGTTIRDYGFMLRTDPAYAEKAAAVSALARDISEYLATLELKLAPRAQNPVVAYHSACSLQHGQKVTDLPKALLRKAGFTVKDVPEGHICCGSAGTYNILQPDLSGQLRDRKVKNIARTKADIIAAGNIGCMVQIGAGTGTPVVHTAELIDWATGGPEPEALRTAGAGGSPR
ncbi:glycolate oxidase subunit GlcF [Pseudoxanthobacter sp.]|uniref:glycolate oxidase subunit GlcF n=1 Tax=Pseudoxanthobacter sp. TaxID=1925742 RepID=UPI002FDFA329